MDTILRRVYIAFSMGFDPSLEGVCLFSFLGLMLSLALRHGLPMAGG